MHPDSDDAVYERRWAIFSLAVFVAGMAALLIGAWIVTH